MARRIIEQDHMVAEAMRKHGYTYTAQYIEMFGASDMNPWFWNGSSDKSEKFYKRCVEEKHRWDYYVDPPGEDAVL